MRRAFVVVLVILSAVAGCNFGPWKDAEVALDHWSETEHHYTAHFKNNGKKDAKNVKVKLKCGCNRGGEGYTNPRLLTPGSTGVASLSKRGCTRPLRVCDVVWVKWD